MRVWANSQDKVGMDTYMSGYYIPPPSISAPYSADTVSPLPSSASQLSLRSHASPAPHNPSMPRHTTRIASAKPTFQTRDHGLRLPALMDLSTRARRRQASAEIRHRRCDPARDAGVIALERRPGGEDLDDGAGPGLGAGGTADVGEGLGFDGCG